MEIELTESASADLAYWRTHSLKTATRIEALIRSCCETPFSGLGKPEALRHQLSGYWSRRINARDRMVYSCDGKTLTIISLRFHYGE